MSSTNQAISFESVKSTAPATVQAAASAVDAAPLPKATSRVPNLKVVPLLRDTQTRRFARVPTHAVGVVPELRTYPRASLQLPLRLRSANGIAETFPITLVTRDVSSTGVYFLSPRELPAATPIELEIVLISRPLGRGNVVMASLAHVQRCEPAATPGWYGIAASFDDVQFDRDDRLPFRFLGF